MDGWLAKILDSRQHMFSLNVRIYYCEEACRCWGCEGVVVFADCCQSSAVSCLMFNDRQALPSQHSARPCYALHWHCCTHYQVPVNTDWFVKRLPLKLGITKTR